VYRFAISVEIDASPARVWRALCAPDEVVRWDSGIERALDAPADYPLPGQHVRWRCRSGPFRLLHDRPQEVVLERRLRSLLSLGPFRYDETYTLAAAGHGACNLTASLAVWVPLPLIGALAARAYLGPSARRSFESALASIKRLCEAVSGASET
jgi:hypothetical protein